jgi:hypothetical protein
MHDNLVISRNGRGQVMRIAGKFCHDDHSASTKSYTSTEGISMAFTTLDSNTALIVIDLQNGIVPLPAGRLRFCFDDR